MPARERRIVHMTLRKDDRVRTKSYGSGRGRAVTIFPKDKFSQ
jgi:predicted RNA-binding protein Jag